MFGAPRRLPAGPALLSITSGAPLLTAALYSRPHGWHIRVDAPLEFEPTGERRADVRALTRRIAAAFERSIAAQPTDWHLFQPGWPSADASARASGGSPTRASAAPSGGS
jgi:KDO2-lipid IV(A) lauroyltransferase